MGNPDITDPAIVPSNEPEKHKAKKIIPKRDLDLIFEVGLDMGMDREEIWEFADESNIAKELADFRKARERQRDKLADVLLLSEKEKNEIQKTTQRFLEAIIRKSIKFFRHSQKSN